MSRNRIGWILLVASAAVLLPQSALAAKKVLRIRLDGPVREAPDEAAQIMSILSGEQSQTLYGMIDTLDQAAADDEIAGIALIIEQPAMGFAQIEELSRAMAKFRKSGKKIYCYMDYAGNGGYAIACATDHVTLAENSQLAIMGINAELDYYKNLLTKIGVQADILHCGDYKSAGEPFTRTEPSKPAADNINWLLDGIYDRWLELMANGRGVSISEVSDAVDHAPVSAAKALELKLVDSVSSFDDFRKRIHKEFGKDVEIVKKYGEKDGLELDFNNPFALFRMIGEMFEKQQKEAQPGIAILYIEGPIVMGTSDSGPFGGSGMAGSTTIRAAFEQAREDDSIKAVVVRVNSPGGSALASDIMWEAATRCAAEKPLIVSMGNVAGSGGYYVAIPGDTIFAEEATITASIGVVGGKFIWNELMEDKLGITTTSFKRGGHADLLTMTRPWTEDERAWMIDYMNETYEQFKGRIRTSRGERIKGNLDDMAGGRVFTGKQALELGLVDKIGGLADALKLAAERVGLDEYEVYVLPEQKDPFEQIIAELTGQETEDEWEISTFSRGAANSTYRASSEGLLSSPLLRAALPLLQHVAPERVRSVVDQMNQLTILQEEHVGCFMPFDLTIR